MALTLNPMGLTNPNAAAPVQQPDFRVPTVNASVGAPIVGADMLTLSYVMPPAKFRQPGIDQDFPF
jgi:hypothetical protein